MDFSIEPNEPLIDRITITVYADEYREQYQKQLKQTARNVSLPGFRPGMVPASLVKKRFGASLLADQINKLVSKGLSEFIEEQQIRFLGRPYLVDNPFDRLDPEGNQDLSFTFEVGREPEFELNLAALQPVHHYQVTVTDADVAEALERYRYQFGVSTPAERVEPGQPYNIAGIVNLAEPQDPENPNEPRLPLPRLLYVHTVLTPELRPLVEGKAQGDAVDLHLGKLQPDDLAAAALLRVDPDTYQLLKNRPLRYELRQISLNQPAELGAEFYGKVLQGAAVPGDEAAFRLALKAKLETDAQTMADVHVNDVARRDLLLAHPFELPDRILIRWLVDEFEDFRKPGELERRYPQYRADMRFHLIQRKLKEQFPELELSQDDLKTELRSRYASYFQLPAPEPSTQPEAEPAAEGGEEAPASQADAQGALLDMLINNVMQDENLYQREYNFLSNKRFFEGLQQQVLAVTSEPINYRVFEQKVATGAR